MNELFTITCIYKIDRVNFHFMSSEICAIDPDKHTPAHGVIATL